MNDPAIPDLCHRVADLMCRRLGAHGGTLEQTLRQRGRQLPRRVRRAATELAEVEMLCGHPQLRQRVDHRQAARAGKIVMEYLQPLGGTERRWRLFLSIAASMAFGLLATIAGVIAVLKWRGYL